MRLGDLSNMFNTAGTSWQEELQSYHIHLGPVWIKFHRMSRKKFQDRINNSKFAHYNFPNPFLLPTSSHVFSILCSLSVPFPITRFLTFRESAPKKPCISMSGKLQSETHFKLCPSPVQPKPMLVSFHIAHVNITPPTDNLYRSIEKLRCVCFSFCFWQISYT